MDTTGSGLSTSAEFAQAEALGRFVAQVGLIPELVLTSPAVRTATTADLAAAAGSWNSEIVTVPDLYGAEPNSVLSLIRGIDGADRVMVVGHEPTMSGLIGRMTGSHLRVPTGALTSLRLFYSRWADLGWGTAEVELYIRPRLLLDGSR